MLLEDNVDDGDSGVDAMALRFHAMAHSKGFTLIIPFTLTMTPPGGIAICISDSSSKGMGSNGLQYLLKVTQLDERTQTV